MTDDTNDNPNRAEAERLLGVAEKLLQSRDFNGTKDFAVLAQETEPLLEGPDQILAVAEVLLSAEKRINNHHDWYSILQLDRRTDDNEIIKKQYRRLALLLHPDKNKFPFADQAFKLVADAWAVLSDSPKKSLYDNELSLFSKVDLSNAGKLPVRRSQRPSARNNAGENARNNVNVNNSSSNNNPSRGEHSQRSSRLSSFWTICPYCYIMYEYPRVYENCCLRCQKCERAFHAALIQSLPPLVPGKEAYYCSWGFFPLGFMFGGAENGEKSSGVGAGSGSGSAFVNWMPPIFGAGQQGSDKNGGPARAATPLATGAPRPAMVRTSPSMRGSSSGMMPKRKRGRPRKYPIPGQT